MTKTRIDQIRQRGRNIHSVQNQHQYRPPIHKMIRATLTRRAKAEAAKMLPQPAVQIRDVFKVSAWKWGIDNGSPLWRRFFFVWIFLPFLDLAFKLGIPTPKEVLIESDERGNVRRTYRWFEDQGIFEQEDQADAGCLEERWGYTLLPYGRLMPPDSAQYQGTIFPRKKKGSRKWAKPKFPFVIKDRKQDEKVEQTFTDYLRELNQVLDR